MIVPLYRFLAIFSILAAAFSALFALTLHAPEYSFLPVLPLSYVLIGPVFLSVSWRQGPSLFLLICFPTAFLRYVAFPFLVVFNGGYAGRSLTPPLESSYHYAIGLMAYELLVVGLAVFLLERRYQLKELASSLQLSSIDIRYSLFLSMLALALCLAVPQSLLYVNFFKPTIYLDEFSAAAVPTFLAIFFVAAKAALLIGLMQRLAFSSRAQNLAPWLAALLCAINIGIFFGTNRMAMTLTAIGSVWVLLALFKKRSHGPILAIAMVAVVVFGMITTERQYVRMSDSAIENVADNIQGYTGGLYNVAIGVETGRSFPEATSLEVLVYDFLRPTVGVNLLVQGWETLYSNIYFNYRMWTTVERRSQILPMIAQGNLFFPFLLAPLLSLLFVSVGYFLLGLLDKVALIELRYFIVLVVLRMGFFWGQNSMNMMSYISLNLAVPIFMIIGVLLYRKVGRRD